MTTFGVSLARVGRSAAGARIEAKGRKYERLQSDLGILGKAVTLQLLSTKLQQCGQRLSEEMSAMQDRLARSSPQGLVRTILKEVSAKHDIPVIEIISDRRATILVRARQEVMYRAVMETTLSLPVIGRLLHRDHTSIGHGVMKHAHLNGLPLPRSMQHWSYRGKTPRAYRRTPDETVTDV